MRKSFKVLVLMVYCKIKVTSHPFLFMWSLIFVVLKCHFVLRFCQNCIYIVLFILYFLSLWKRIWILHLEASEPKWVNSILDIIVVNSLRLWGLHFICCGYVYQKWMKSIYKISKCCSRQNYILVAIGHFLS